MKRGKYSAPRRGPSPITVFFWVVFLVILIIAAIFLFKSCSQTDVGASTDPETQTSQAVTTDPSTYPTTEPATVPSTQAPTIATTEPSTEPATEPVTEPTTVPTVPAEEDTADPDSTLGQDIAALAKSVVGKPYLKGGEGPDGFDTSGLIVYCYKEHDISVAHNTAKLFAAGQEVAKEDLQPGDVVFFYLETPGKAEYVGIYVGDNTFVAVSSSKNAVLERNMGSSYYTEHFVGARRYISGTATTQ